MQLDCEQNTVYTRHNYSGRAAKRRSINVLMSGTAPDMPDTVKSCPAAGYRMSGTGHGMSGTGKFMFEHRYFLCDVGSDMRVYGHITDQNQDGRA